jgi:hypothetical protein
MVTAPDHRLAWFRPNNMALLQLKLGILDGDNPLVLRNVSRRLSMVVFRTRVSSDNNVGSGDSAAFRKVAM